MKPTGEQGQNRSQGTEQGGGQDSKAGLHSGKGQGGGQQDIHNAKDAAEHAQRSAGEGEIGQRPSGDAPHGR